MMDKELLSGFVAETFDLLDDVEPQLIELSHSGDTAGIDMETLNSVFRLFHSMKGSAGFLGLSTVSGVTHEAETLLDLFRKGKATLESEHVQVLCESIDFIRILLDTIEHSDSDAGHEGEAESIIEKLHALIAALSGSGTGKSKTSKKKSTKGKSTAPAPQTTPVETEPTAQHEIPEVEITPAMRKSFVQEAEEFLDQAEQALLVIEKAEDDELAEQLTTAFRALHSLKGNSGFMGFPDIERLAHCMESALDGMRQGTVEPDPGSVGVLLSLLDVLREAVGRISGEGAGTIANLDVYIELLQESIPSVVVGDEKPDSPVPPAAAKIVEKKPDASIPATTNQPDRTPAARTRQDIRVDIEKLDALINLVGELVIAEAMVTRHPHVADAEIENLDSAVHLLRRVSRDLQDVAMSARMIPLAGTFRKMIRLVHDLSSKAGKKIELKLVGEDTEVDKTVIEQIADPLVHIVRNSCDHGIETPNERISSDKPEQATVTIEGRHEGGEVWILISDDGRGLNREKILSKAKQNGLVGSDADDWPDDRVFKLIFEPGFSTADKVTDVSGRGVGMDVVRKNIEKLKGKVDIRSTPGKGTTIILRIPLTLAIIEGMLVRIGSARYTIPMLAIRESFRPAESWVTVTPDGQESVRIRDDFFPVVRLHERFKKEPDTANLEEGIIVLVESDRHTVALFVDEILGQQETVIKGMSEFLGDSGGVSGCTILGDGEVSLILDIAGLVLENGLR